MRIGIDTRPLAEEKKSGVEEYIFNLLEALFTLDRENEYILFYNAHKKGLPRALVDFEKYPNVFIRRYHYPNKLLNLALWYWGRPFLDRLTDVKVFYSPNLIFTSLSSRCRHLLTIHDLSFEIHPEFFDLYRRLWHWLINPRKLIKKAARVIAVSDSTKEDLVNIYHCNPAKIKRIYPGISKKVSFSGNLDRKFLNVSFKYQLPEKYILSLATLEPRKNIDSVILSYDKLRKDKRIDHKLVIAGAEGWNFERTKDLILGLGRREDIFLIGEVDSEDRKYVYAGADVFVYPSFYEGFGFPPLEALACGTTVVCSFSSSLPEAVGNSALLVDSHNREELAWAMEQGIRDKKLKLMLKRSGLKRAIKFSWEESAQEFLKVVNSEAKPDF